MLLCQITFALLIRQCGTRNVFQPPLIFHVVWMTHVISYYAFMLPLCSALSRILNNNPFGYLQEDAFAGILQTQSGPNDL